MVESWAIQQVSTGLWMPTVRGRAGATYAIIGSGPPRLFTRRSSARQCLDWWLLGRTSMQPSYDGEYDLMTQPDRSRLPDDYRVVRVQLVIQEEADDAKKADAPAGTGAVAAGVGPHPGGRVGPSEGYSGTD